MPNNYVLLDRIELNNTAASVTFDNIPQSGYTDLKLVISARSSTTQGTGGFTAYLYPNGSTSSMTNRQLRGSGSAATSVTGQTNPINVSASDTTANTFGNTEVYIPNYRSNQFKSMSIDGVEENNASNAFMSMNANLWSSTAAITSLVITAFGSGTFAINSTFSLYGLAQVGTTPAIAPKADGGNVIGTDGTYWYHEFNSNGTFTPQVGLICEYLVIAGGGAGGPGRGAGGGAGGYRTSVVGATSGANSSAESTMSLTANTSYAVAVGAGGVSTTITVSTSGSNSSFNGVSSIGGGFGTTLFGPEGGSGGSGGGGSSGSGILGVWQNGGAGTALQGRAGGNGNTVGTEFMGGGGGGASGLGATAGTNVGGAGGIGLANSITGTSVFRGGGGGGGGDARNGGTSGGSGGTGGGGAGNTGSAGVAGTVNTGGGGGGGGMTNSPTANFSYVGGQGGSGIVIIRYLVA
jgi:hypothetical protein